MQLRHLLLSSTFVLLTAQSYAAPHLSQPDLEDVPPSPTSAGEPPSTLNEMQISPAPVAKKTERHQYDAKEYFYPFQSAMGPRVGLLLDSQRLADREVLYLIGFFYLLPSMTSRHFEVGSDLQSDRTGTINGAVRWIFFSTEALRPFVKAGLSMLVESEKGLANAIDYKQYRLRVGGGVEDVLKDPASLRFDVELTAGFKEVALNLVFGYSWGW